MAMYLWVDNSRLPSEYQEVEYIQSSGTQYFIVGSSFKTSYKSVIDLEMVVTGGDYIPLGVHNDAGKRYGIDVYGGKFTVISGGGSWTNTATEDTNRHLITIDKTTATVDGTSYSISYVDFTYEKGVGVFGYHNTQTNGVNYKSSNKLYKLDIYDENGTQIYDLVPCYRKLDSVIGMYDIINDVFYTNEGTGTFTKGNDVNVDQEKEVKNMYIGQYPGGGLPSEYQEVEYIESSGTQLIDTGYLITPNTEVAVDYQFTNANSQDFVFGIGSDSNTSSGVTFCIYIGNTGGNYYFKVGISDGTNANTWENKLLLRDTNRHTFVVNNGHSEMYDSSGTLETSISTIETFTRTAGHSFGLFCWWRTDVNPARRENKTAAKLYGCTIKESGTLQRNFVPCYRKLDSVIGMYDLVNGVFYTNSGTGTFTKGSDV